ncbi:MAG TPA: ISKra4 family transposase [Longimicrobiales bacterium]|nr:ISKra4 family transposase [Longimicrobiales bacterium]
MGSAAATPTSWEPTSALGAGREAFRNLERWLCSRASRTLSISAIERETEQRGREGMRLLVQAHVDGYGIGDVGPALYIAMPDAAPALLTHRRIQTRRLHTVFGTVFIRRVGYGKRGQYSLHPLDATLELPSRIYSYELQRRLVKAALQGPFDEALERVAESTGVEIPKRSAEQIVLEASLDFDEFYAQRSGPACASDDPVLVAAIDSKGIPMVKTEPAQRRIRLQKGEKRNRKRMATVAAVFGQAPQPRTPQSVVDSLFACSEPSVERKRSTPPQRKRVWASLLRDKEAFIGDVREEMLRRDPVGKLPWIIVTDGERGLQHRVCRQFQDVPLVLDLFHVLEKLWGAAHALHTEGSQQAETFVRDRLLRILNGHVSQVVKGLRQSVTKRKLRGVKHKAMLSAAGYFYRNRSRMRYNVYLAKGWPIASGSVEGACKNLVKDRMERSGMRWTPAMAEAMLRLRATYLSGDFEEYWAFHVRQEQRRLYPCPVAVVAK